MKALLLLSLMLMLFPITGCKTTSKDSSESSIKEAEDCSRYRFRPRLRRQCEERNSAANNGSGEVGNGQDVLIVVMGGWKSCKGVMPIRTPRNSFLSFQYGKMVEDLRRAGQNVRTLLTCYGIGTPIRSDVFTSIPGVDEAVPG